MRVAREEPRGYPGGFDNHTPTMLGGNGIPYVTKLDADNYLVWRFQMEHVLRLYDCWSAVAPAGGAAGNAPAGSATVATTAVAAADARTGAGGAAAAVAGAAGPPTKEEARADEVAKAIMALNVQTQYMATIRRHPTARGVWDALAAECYTRGPMYAARTRQELYLLKIGANESVAQYVSRKRTLAWKLLEMGHAVDDKSLAMALLDGVRPQLSQHMCLDYESGLTVPIVLGALRGVERRLEQGF